MIHKLEVDSVLLEYGGRRILSDVYLKSETGRITGLLGRNGNGKTSLMNIIFGSLTPTSKSVRFNGDNIQAAYKEAELVLYLPQYHFIPGKLTLKRIFSDFNLVYDTFESSYPEFRNKYNNRIDQLSGGQRRFIEVYVILKSPSKFVMLDEPFSQLSPLLIEALKTLIIEQKEIKGLLLTDHMYQHVMEISEDLYLLSEGNVHLIKNVEEIERLGYARINSSTLPMQ